MIRRTLIPATQYSRAVVLRYDPQAWIFVLTVEQNSGICWLASFWPRWPNPICWLMRMEA